MNKLITVFKLLSQQIIRLQLVFKWTKAIKLHTKSNSTNTLCMASTTPMAWKKLSLCVAQMSKWTYASNQVIQIHAALR